MMLNRALRFMALVLALGILGVAGCGPDENGKDEATTIHLAHVLTDKHPVHKAMVRMSEIFEKKVGETLEIDIRHSAQLGAEKELIEKVQAGSIQMTKVSSSALESNVPELGVLALPFLFRDEAHQWAVLEGEIGRELLEGLDAAGLKGLTYYDAGARSIYARDPIGGVEDLDGLKIRVQESPTMKAAMEALGAEPVAIPFGSALTQQLQKGERVTAAENNPPSYWTEGHYKYCPYYFLDKHSRPVDVLVMNLTAWNSLSADEQKALQAAADESLPYQRELWDEQVETIFEKLVDEGVTITRDVDSEPFIEAARPVYEDLPEGKRALVERIRAVE